MKKDLEKYLLSVQKQVADLDQALKEAEELYKSGEVEESVVEQIRSLSSNIYNNYQRIMYCKYLYTKPPKFIQKLTDWKLKKKLEQFKEDNVTSEQVIEENQVALENIKESIGMEDKSNE